MAMSNGAREEIAARASNPGIAEVFRASVIGTAELGLAQANSLAPKGRGLG
jgi:hypothetical protein